YSLALELIDAAHETVFNFFEFRFVEFGEVYLHKEENTEVILRELKLEIERFFVEETSDVYNDSTEWYRFFCYCTYYLSLYLLFKDKTRLSPEQRIQVYKSLAKSHLNNYYFPSQFVRLGSNYLYNLMIKESEVFSSFLPAYNKNFETDGLL
ncbi:MAG: hypothetical protein SFU98_15795, partial [Leptospiraceae bacterium]|nr:hypothetical protein [Leptospiraceae bacterium]